MKEWEIDITCPLCGIKTRLNKMQRHKNKKHPEYTNKEYDELLESHIKQHPDMVDTKRVYTGNADATATKALIKQKQKYKKITGIVSGGAIELGKKH